MLRAPGLCREVGNAVRALSMQRGWGCFACHEKLFRKVAGFCTELTALLRLQEYAFCEREKDPLRGRGRGSESPPLHPLKNPHNPPKRVLRRRTPVG